MWKLISSLVKNNSTSPGTRRRGSLRSAQPSQDFLSGRAGGRPAFRGPRRAGGAGGALGPGGGLGGPRGAGERDAPGEGPGSRGTERGWARPAGFSAGQRGAGRVGTVPSPAWAGGAGGAAARAPEAAGLRARAWRQRCPGERRLGREGSGFPSAVPLTRSL